MKTSFRSAVLCSALFLVLVAGCGGPNVVGKWELLDPVTKQTLGDVMTIEKAGKWHRTGFPAMEGTYRWEGDTLHFSIQKVGEMTRQQAIDSMKGKADVEAQLEKLEKQYTFKLVEEDGTTYLKQDAPVGGFSLLLFRKKAE
ncbi:MAG TPA: hypothetical protein VNI20_03070 [Fimbriimonadaceae bacterium]|nr:hypothetical protein [Fimbriimonadaceae bacterium]